MKKSMDQYKNVPKKEKDKIKKNPKQDISN